MTDTPYENSLTVNTTAQMMDEVKPPYDSTAAISPSTRDEKFLGYDVEYPFLKGLYLQYKRPHILSYKGEPFSFHTSHPEQLETLKRLADIVPNFVYYALPMVQKNSLLDSSLQRTLFVKVSCLKENTSRIRVYWDESKSKTSYANPRASGIDIDYIEAKVKNGDWYELSQNCWSRWEDFVQGIRSSRSAIHQPMVSSYPDEESDTDPVGVILKSDNEPTRAPDRQESVGECISEFASSHNLQLGEKGQTIAMFARQ